MLCRRCAAFRHRPPEMLLRGAEVVVVRHDRRVAEPVDDDAQREPFSQFRFADARPVRLGTDVPITTVVSPPPSAYRQGFRNVL